MQENDKKKIKPKEEEVTPIFSAIDTDLAMDNLMNEMDITAADSQDF